MLECRLGFMLRCLLQNTAGPSRLSLSSNHSCSTPLDSFQQQCSRMAVAAFVPARRKHLSDWISLSLVYYVFVSLWRVGYKVVPPFIFTKRRWDAVKHNVFGHRLLWWFSTPVIKFSALTNSFSPLSLIFQRIVIWHTRTYTYSSRPLSCFFFFFLKKRDISLSLSLCFSLQFEHMHRVSDALCLPFRTAALAFLSLRSPLCPHTRPSSHPCIHTPARP